MQRVSTLSPERWPALLALLNDLAASHHLQTYFNQPPVENEMQVFGWAGQLNPRGTYDFMSEVESNLGATKANYFVTRQYSIVLTRSGNVLHHTVTVKLVNNMPYAYKPNEYYKVYMRLFIPSNAGSGKDNLRRESFADPAPPSGLHQLTGWMTIPGYGNTGQAVFQYDTPWLGLLMGQHEIYWEPEAGISDDKVSVTWNDGNGHQFETSGALSQDSVIVLSPTGVIFAPTQIASATLPSLSLG